VRVSGALTIQYRKRNGLTGASVTIIAKAAGDLMKTIDEVEAELEVVKSHIGINHMGQDVRWEGYRDALKWVLAYDSYEECYRRAIARGK